MTIHTRYIVDNVTVCEEPARLDFHELVVGDTSDSPEPLCRECSALISAHNKREYEKEAYSSMSIVQRNPKAYDVDPNRSDIFVSGLALGSAFWITVLVIVWAVFLRCG